MRSQLRKIPSKNEEISPLPRFSSPHWMAVFCTHLSGLFISFLSTGGPSLSVSFCLTALPLKSSIFRSLPLHIVTHSRLSPLWFCDPSSLFYSFFSSSISPFSLRYSTWPPDRSLVAPFLFPHSTLSTPVIRCSPPSRSLGRRGFSGRLVR